MSKGWNYKSGDWWLQCDVCSKKIKASEAKQRWDGYVVCEEDYENRHPQDFIRAKMDKISVPFTRPRSPDVFIEPVCTFITGLGEADIGTADCAKADFSPDYDWTMWASVYCSIDEQRGIAGVGTAGCMKPNKYIMGYL